MLLKMCTQKYIRLTNEKVFDTFYQKLYRDTELQILKLQENGFIDHAKQQGYSYLNIFDEYNVRDLLSKRYQY